MVRHFRFTYDPKTAYCIFVIDEDVVSEAAWLLVVRRPRTGMAALCNKVGEAGFCGELERLTVGLQVKVTANNSEIAGLGYLTGNLEQSFCLPAARRRVRLPSRVPQSVQVRNGRDPINRMVVKPDCMGVPRAGMHAVPVRRILLVDKTLYLPNDGKGPVRESCDAPAGGNRSIAIPEEALNRRTEYRRVIRQSFAHFREKVGSLRKRMYAIAIGKPLLGGFHAFGNLLQAKDVRVRLRQVRDESTVKPTTPGVKGYDFHCLFSSPANDESARARIHVTSIT